LAAVKISGDGSAVTCVPGLTVTVTFETGRLFSTTEKVSVAPPSVTAVVPTVWVTVTPGGGGVQSRRG
jgi:hypothetical protein